VVASHFAVQLPDHADWGQEVHGLHWPRTRLPGIQTGQNDELFCERGRKAHNGNLVVYYCNNVQLCIICVYAGVTLCQIFYLDILITLNDVLLLVPIV
jgi:hypothetical protein